MLSKVSKEGINLGTIPKPGKENTLLTVRPIENRAEHHVHQNNQQNLNPH